MVLNLVAKQEAPLQVGHAVDPLVEQHSDVKALSPDVPDAGHAEMMSVHERSQRERDGGGE